MAKTTEEIQAIRDAVNRLGSKQGAADELGLPRSTVLKYTTDMLGSPRGGGLNPAKRVIEQPSEDDPEPDNLPATADRPMTRGEAMQKTDRIRHALKAIGGMVDSTRKLLVEMRDRKGWVALGYDSWTAYLATEHETSRSYVYFQIKAAEVERDVDPDGKPGTIPEGQLRALSKLPPEERKEAWEEAKAEAPDGNVTGKLVEEVVNRRTGKPGSDEPGDPNDPPDIARQRRNGIIPKDAKVTVTEPGPADEDEPPDVQAEQTDDEFLADCPARRGLTESRRKVFDRHALLFRDAIPFRKAYYRHVKPLMNVVKGAGPTESSYYEMSRHFRGKHPKQWVLCKDCDGSGQVPLIGKCPTCYGQGYIH